MDARLGRRPAPSWVLGLLDRSVLLSLPGYYRLLGTPARDRDLHRAGAMAHSEPDPRVQPCDDRLHDARGRRHVPAGARVDRPRRRGVHRRRRVRMRAVPVHRSRTTCKCSCRDGCRSPCTPCTGSWRRDPRAPWRCSSSRSCSRHTRTATSSISLRSPRPRSSCTACGAAGTTSLGCCRVWLPRVWPLSLRSRQSRGPTCACGGSRGSRAPPGTSCSSHRTCRHTHTSARACGRGGTCCRLVATSRSCFPV